MTGWYEQSFGQDYLLIYKHRDIQGAISEVEQMIAWLNMPTGAHVLDLCCGMGRHSLALANAGYKVTGVDLSEVLLQEARQLDRGAVVEWVHGDMRKVPLTESFDAVVNLFTSFGYFAEDKDNEQVIREMQRLLRTEGKFIIDFLNPDNVQDHLIPYSDRNDGDVDIIESRYIKDGYVLKEITIHEAGQPERHYTERVRLYRLVDFEHMFTANGLQIDCVLGDYDGSTYTKASSPRMILVGSKR